MVNRLSVGRPAPQRPGASCHAQVPLLGFVGVRVCLFVCLDCTVWFVWSSVTHLLGDLVRVEDSRDRHLDFVFLLLRLTERRLPLLQEQVGRVLACKLLKGRQRRTRHGELWHLRTQEPEVSDFSGKLRSTCRSVGPCTCSPDAARASLSVILQMADGPHRQHAWRRSHQLSADSGRPAQAGKCYFWKQQLSSKLCRPR